MKKLLLILLLALTACGHPPQAQLRSADAIIEADPDSAMALLGAIDRARLSPADSAYFALLYTQAQIKTGVYLTSDSLISQALAAYRFSSTPSLRLRAHFYAAKVAYRQSLYREAMRNAVVAYDVAHELNDPYWIAKSAEMLGDIYNVAYNYTQSGRYTKLAADQYLKAGKIRNHRFALCDLAGNYCNKSLFDSAYILIDSIKAIARNEQPVDSSLLNYAQHILVDNYWIAGDYDAMSSEMVNYKHNTPDKSSNLIYSLVESYAASNRGDSIEFTKFMTEAYGLATNEAEILQIVYADYCNAVAQKDYERAIILSDSVIHLQCRVADVLLDESVTAIQSDYYASQSVIKNQKNKFLSRLLIILAVSAVIIIALLYLIYNLRLKAAKADIQANIAAMQALKAKSADNEQFIQSLLKNRWLIVNRLCGAYYGKARSENLQKYLVNEIESELGELRTPETISEIIEAADKITGGAVSMLRAECPFLKEQDIEFIGLIYAGLSVRAVCYIAQIKKDYFYKKKNRLIRRIEDSDAPSKARFIDQLSKFTA